MPFYRMGDGVVHIKLAGKAAKNPPKQCVAPHQPPDRAYKVKCCAMSTYLCDHVNSDGSTCDAPLCAEHAHEVGKDKHLCPRHLAEKKAGELF